MAYDEFDDEDEVLDEEKENEEALEEDE